VIRISEAEKMEFLEIGDEVVDSLGVEALMKWKFDVREFIGSAGK
jgi:hypothetical protein